MRHFKNGRVWTGVCFTILLVAASRAAWAQPVTVTEPLMTYGLGTLMCATYSKDGKYIATGGGIGAVIRNAETGEQVRILTAPGHYVLSVAFSPDGTKVLTGSWDYTAELWDASTGAEIRPFPGHTERVYSVAFSPDGTKVLTGSWDNTARLWEASTGALIRTFSDPGISWIKSVAYSPDGAKVLAGGVDGNARLWDATAGGAPIQTFSGHSGSINAVAFSPDGTKVLTGSNDCTAKLWDVSTSTSAAIRTFSGHTNWVQSVAFSPDGTKVLTGGRDSTAKLWDASTGDPIRTFSGHTMNVYGVGFSPDGARVLTAGEEGTVKSWNALTGDVVWAVAGSGADVHCAVFSRDGTKVLTGSQSEDNTARLWDATTGAAAGIREFHGQPFVETDDPMVPVAFSPDGTKVLMGNWQYATPGLWDASTGVLLRTFPGHWGYVRSVAFSPDGTKVLTGSRDMTAKLWDVSTTSSAAIRTFTGHTGEVKSVAFSPDGTKVLTGSDDCTAKTWDASTGGAPIQTFSGHTAPVNSAVFSPDGKKVLTGCGAYQDSESESTAKLWDVATSTVIRTFSGSTGSIWSVAFSPDGTKVLTGSGDVFATVGGDYTARLWDVATGAEVRRFSRHSWVVRSVAFSPDGTRVLTGSRDGLTFLWDSGVSIRKLDKIILVAGGGAYKEGNPIAAQTKSLAELAYVTATVRGYTPENIRYLSAFETPAQNPRVDGAASADAITSAALHWASDARRLTIILIDHGEYDPGIPEWYFLVDGTRSPRNYLMASALDAALNTAQLGADPLPELCVYVDMCYAGGFVKKLSAAPAGTQRIVIASTTSDRLANFGGGDSGALSFSGFFLSSALLGRTLEDCFGSARTVIVALNLPSAAPQTPWLDDDGDNQFTKSDGAVAGRHVFGSHPAFGLLPPEITAARATERLAAPSDYQVWLELGPGPVKRAQAIVSSSADYYPGGAPITNIKTYDLAREGVTQRWSATIPAVSLRDNTFYTIVYVAYRDDGFGLEIASEPWTSTLGVNIRAEVPKGRWELYE